MFRSPNFKYNLYNLLFIDQYVYMLATATHTVGHLESQMRTATLSQNMVLILGS
jgi:hypothetical protein